MRALRIAAPALLLLAAGLPAGTARAQLARGISDADYFNHPDPAIRQLGLARARRAGARHVRIQLSGWRVGPG